jgi:hypothetical protein
MISVHAENQTKPKKFSLWAKWIITDSKPGGSNSKDGALKN